MVCPNSPSPKKNGQVRIRVDLKKLREAGKRERYVLPIVGQIEHIYLRLFRTM